jgi:hypothetical protein
MYNVNGISRSGKVLKTYFGDMADTTKTAIILIL